LRAGRSAPLLSFRVGKTGPAEDLAHCAGGDQLTLGFKRSSLALSFLAPQEGNRFRSARISFSISANVAYGEVCGVRTRSSRPSGPTWS
jgi:hypothetical protein